MSPVHKQTRSKILQLQGIVFCERWSEYRFFLHLDSTKVSVENDYPLIFARKFSSSPLFYQIIHYDCYNFPLRVEWLEEQSFTLLSVTSSKHETRLRLFSLNAWCTISYKMQNHTHKYFIG